MYKIAHISDLHISANDVDSEKLFSRLISDITDKNCNHIILTGDFVHQPTKENFDYVKYLFRNNNIYSRDKLTVIPGNHEIFGGADKKGKSFLFPTQCKNQDYDLNLENVSDFLEEIFPERFDGEYPFIKILTDKIVLSCFNSVEKWDRDMNPIGSNGFINEFQLDRFDKLQKQIKNFRYKIALVHHHFFYIAENGEDEVHTEWLYSERNTMQLHNRNEFANILKSAGISCICHGHTHYTNSYFKDGMHFINSSGCFFPFSADEEKYYHIMEFSNEELASLRINKINYKEKN